MSYAPPGYSLFTFELYVRVAILIAGWKRLGRWPKIEGDDWLMGRLNEAKP